MKEENNNASKNNWRRIFRKKWFFPAVYLTIAAILLAVVIWYQNLDNQLPEMGETEDLTEDYIPNLHDEDAEAVMDQQENVLMPVSDEEQAEIVTKFFDYNSDEENQKNALILYNNRYYQSTGIDIKFADDEAFDVVASLTGTVTEVKEDPLLGNVVVLSHDNDITTYYASLGEVNVEPEDEVSQGDVIGTAGKNLFGKDNGTHVHFELRKDDTEVNPETYFNQPVSKLDSDSEDVSEVEGETSSIGSEDVEESEENANDRSVDEDPEHEQADENNDADSDNSNENTDSNE